MNTDIAKGKWLQLTGTVKQKWGKLTQDEVEQMEGKFEVFYGKMQEKYGMSKEKARREFNALQS
ncbi:CsbD family protein [Aestuariibacter sp. GS-14]|uniref:CsbD family protein n=1 Tax=Alteromonadaceae TaxID=72275 RepID=UPI00112ACEA3|nr:CsbD family protein [Aestuariibacter sp. GS-14]TPV55368.1 CsbD family protein [Aestuariibacter sp. GS-14]